MFGGNFAPVGWALCDGSLMAIDQNAALFQLIGTTYGGDGVSTFALPNLQGRVPIHQGGSSIIGLLAGSETITLVAAQVPGHVHTAFGTSAGASTGGPAGALYAVTDSAHQLYAPAAAGAPAVMAPQTLSPGGGTRVAQQLDAVHCHHLHHLVERDLSFPKLGATVADQFLGEIRIFGGNFAPSGWATCDGQLLAISQNTALFSILGTMYGGNGTTNFALPNLQGSVPMDQGNGIGLTPRVVGEVGGVPTVTLLSNELPGHVHSFKGVNALGELSTPGGNLLAEQRTLVPYATPAAGQAMASQAIGLAGGNGPHNNLQPYLVMTFIIALQGVYPTRG
jgi:microcystin-dependent protein